MIVVKIGGAAGIGAESLCEDLARRWKSGERCVVVHGGSDAATSLGEALGHPPRFLQSPTGQVSRYTDAKTLEVFTMATALINRQLVGALQGLGVPAFGVSGIDGALVRAERKAAIRSVEGGRQRIIRDDLSGRPRQVNVGVLQALLGAGLLPVVAPVALGESGQSLNVDGDRLAAAVASALNAHALVILSNVPGVLRDPDDPASRFGEATLDRLRPHAKGRMLKKLLGVEEALAGGVREAFIGDARVPAPLTAALAGAATRIRVADAQEGSMS